MRLKNYKTLFIQKLSSLYPKIEIDTFFFLLIEEYLGFQRIDTVLKADFEISSDKLQLLNNALKKLQNEEPIQYILGKTEFYGFPFLVDKNTLIPRPETEDLVEFILSEVGKLESWKAEKLKMDVSSSLSTSLKINPTEKSLRILDIGTGTGCIPISLAKNLPNTNVSAIDVSKEALKIAKQNATLNNVEVNFIELDILKVTSLNVIVKEERLKQSVNKDEITSLRKDSAQALKTPRNEVQFDIIVSNPPYVRELEKAAIKNNVLKNEPHIALFVEDENPLIFYNKIADLAKIHLTKNGFLFFEINQYLGKETVEMLEEKGFTTIELRKDLFGNDRMIKTSIV